MSKLFGLELDKLTPEQIDHLGEVLTEVFVHLKRHPDESIDTMKQEVGNEAANLMEWLLLEMIHAIEGKQSDLVRYFREMSPMWVRFLLYTSGFSLASRRFNATQKSAWTKGEVDGRPWELAEKNDPYHPKNRQETLKLLGLPVGNFIKFFMPWDRGRITAVRESAKGGFYRWQRHGQSHSDNIGHADFRKELYRKVKEGDYVVSRIRGGIILRKKDFAYSPRLSYEVYKYPLPPTSKYSHEDLSEIRAELEQMMAEDREPKLCKWEGCSDELRSRSRTGFCDQHLGTMRKRRERERKKL